MIIVNVKHEKCDVLCGRGTIWGNPFVIGSDGDRAEVILKHKLWLNMWEFKKQEVPITITGPKGSFTYNNRVVIENIEQLRGKRCGCFCWPQPCHLDNIKEILERPLIRGQIQAFIGQNEVKVPKLAVSHPIIPHRPES